MNRERLRAGDLAEADFYKISLQKLQFEQDVSSAEVARRAGEGGAAAERRLREPDRRLRGRRRSGRTESTPVTLDDLKRDALAARPDLLAAQSGVTLAQHTAGARARQPRARRHRRRRVRPRRLAERHRVHASSIDLPFHDRNQGNIAHSKVAVAQAAELQAFATQHACSPTSSTRTRRFRRARRSCRSIESGYLDQAKQSLDITTYVYQQGSGTLLDLLDAERTYRSTQLAYRQALAAYMTSVQQINFAVGRQVLQ